MMCVIKLLLNDETFNSVHNNTTVINVTHINISCSVIHCYPIGKIKLSLSTSFFNKTLEELSTCSKS